MDTRLATSGRVRRHRARLAFPIWLLFAIPLLLGLGHAAAHGGPFLWLPLLLFWVFGRSLIWPHHHSDELEETSHPADAERDRLGQVELQLVDVRRQIKDLQDQLAWHVKLLAAQQPAASQAPNGPRQEVS